MLDRVANIELNLAGRNRKKSLTKKNFSEIYIAHKLSAKDTLAISPAFKLLKKHSFEVRDFNKNTSDSFALSFILEEFLFQVNPNTSQIIDMHELEYFVRKKTDGKIKVNILARTKISDHIEGFSTIELDSFRFLFKRINDLRITQTIHLQNTLALNNLLDRIYYEILDNFTKINYVVVKFIDLALGKNLIKRCNETDNFNEAILIKKIQPVEDKNV
jgi:hypothetical protein